MAILELSFFSFYVSDDGDDLVRGQHVSEVVTLMGMKTEDSFMVGLERGQCTLAVSALPGRWFVQVNLMHAKNTIFDILGDFQSPNLMIV